MNTSAELKKYIELLRKCQTFPEAVQVFVLVLADDNLTGKDKNTFSELYEIKTDDLPDPFAPVID